MNRPFCRFSVNMRVDAPAPACLRWSCQMPLSHQRIVRYGCANTLQIMCKPMNGVADEEA